MLYGRISLFATTVPSTRTRTSTAHGTPRTDLYLELPGARTVQYCTCTRRARPGQVRTRLVRPAEMLAGNLETYNKE